MLRPYVEMSNCTKRNVTQPIEQSNCRIQKHFIAVIIIDNGTWRRIENSITKRPNEQCCAWLSSLSSIVDVVAVHYNALLLLFSHLGASARLSVYIILCLCTAWLTEQLFSFSRALVFLMVDDWGCRRSMIFDLLRGQLFFFFLLLLSPSPYTFRPRGKVFTFISNISSTLLSSQLMFSRTQLRAWGIFQCSSWLKTKN